MKRFMKKSVFTLLSLLLFLCITSTSALASYEPSIPQPWKSGDGETHGFILESAIHMLGTDKGYSTYLEIANYRHILVKYCDMPDTDELWYASAYHFYNPMTGYNYYPWPTPISIREKTAMVMFKEHSKDAKELYLQGNYDLAFEKLGRAIHYLEDVNVPHHAGGKIAVISNHTKFEKYVLQNQSRYRVFSSDQYDNFSDSSSWEEYCEKTLHASALHAYGYLDDATYTDGNSDEDRARWELAAGPTVGNAQKAVAAYLYNFLKEVGAIK